MRYRPEPPPDDLSDMREYLSRELDRIANAIDSLIELRMEISYVEPPRPRDGDVRFADGTEWDPGSGRGLYERRDGAWEKL